MVECCPQKENGLAEKFFHILINTYEKSLKAVQIEIRGRVYSSLTSISNNPRQVMSTTPTASIHALYSTPVLSSQPGLPKPLLGWSPTREETLWKHLHGRTLQGVVFQPRMRLYCTSKKITRAQQHISTYHLHGEKTTWPLPIPSSRPMMRPRHPDRSKAVNI